VLLHLERAAIENPTSEVSRAHPACYSQVSVSQGYHQNDGKRGRASSTLTLPRPVFFALSVTTISSTREGCVSQHLSHIYHTHPINSTINFFSIPFKLGCT
jgi:hypothetical protein